MALALHRYGDSGPEVFLIHGWALDSRVFEGLIGHWSDRYALRAVDLPGHGASPWTLNVSTIETWADQVAEHLPERACVVGWSLGAMIALQLARSRPAQVARLVLIAGTPRFVLGQDWPAGSSEEGIAHLEELLHKSYSLMVRGFLELQVRGSRHAGATLARLERWYLQGPTPGSAALEAGLDLLRTTDLVAALPSIAQPTLSIAGQYDRIVAPRASELLAQLMPEARALIMPRAAHAPFLSHPKEFFNAVDPFVAGLGAP